MGARKLTELSSVTRPKQARSQKSLLRFLDAGDRLIAKKGFAAVSIADIVRTAKSSVGGFYSRFRDKDELLLALLERHIQQLEVRIAELEGSEIFEGASLIGIVRPCIHELVGTYRERRELFAAVNTRAPNNAPMCELAVAFRNRVVTRFASMVLRRRDQIGHPDPELGVELGVQMVFGLMDQFVISGELRVGGVPLSDAQVERELERCFVAYLGAS